MFSVRLLFQNKGLMHSRRQTAVRTVSGEHRAAASLTGTGTGIDLKGPLYCGAQRLAGAEMHSGTCGESS